MTPHSTVIGEALIDIVVMPGSEPVEHVGGSPANVAIGMARLGHPVALITYLGRDARGTRIAETCRAEGVEVTDGSFAAPRTSTALAEIDSHGKAHYTFDFAFDIDPATGIGASGHVHAGSIAATSPSHEHVRALLEAQRDHATVSYDPNVRPALMGGQDETRAMVEAIVALCDVAKASDEDIAWLYPDQRLEEVMRAWAALGPSIVAVTKGGEGAVILVDDLFYEVPIVETDVADTVGAGDSFMSGMLSGLLDAGLLGGPEQRARLGNATWDDIAPAIERARHTSSITVSRAGSNPPRRDELDA